MAMVCRRTMSFIAGEVCHSARKSVESSIVTTCAITSSGSKCSIWEGSGWYLVGSQYVGEKYVNSK